MFTIFQEEALYWQSYFGLSEWKIYFIYKNLKDRYADILMRWESMSVSIRLNKAWTGKEEIEVRRCAFHEISHLLVVELQSYSYHRDVEEQVHKIIRILENSIFKEHLVMRGLV